MDLTRLQNLKQKLLHDKDLGPVWLYFLDHFGDHSEFHRLGQRTEHATVETILAQIGEQLYGRQGVVSNLVLACVAEQQFIHGGFNIGARIGSVFYFEDAQIGLMTLSELPPAHETRFARFSAQPLPKGRGPSLN